MYKSYYPKAAEIKNDWVVVDAAGQTLGRVAAKANGGVSSQRVVT